MARKLKIWRTSHSSCPDGPRRGFVVAPSLNRAAEIEGVSTGMFKSCYYEPFSEVGDPAAPAFIKEEGYYTTYLPSVDADLTNGSHFFHSTSSHEAANHLHGLLRAALKAFIYPNGRYKPLVEAAG